MHTERHIPSPTKERKEGEQGQHSLQDILLCQGHCLSCARASPGQVQGVQSVYEAVEEGHSQGPAEQCAAATGEQTHIHLRPHCQGKVGVWPAGVSIGILLEVQDLNTGWTQFRVLNIRPPSGCFNFPSLGQVFPVY